MELLTRTRHVLAQGVVAERGRIQARSSAQLWLQLRLDDSEGEPLDHS